MSDKEFQEGMVPIPVCEMCWILDHAKWEPESIGEDGNVVVRLVGIETPDRVITGSTDVCSVCGGITIAGIYELKNESELPYSDDDQDDYYVNGYQSDPSKYIFSLKVEEDEAEDLDE
jgi:hypothetical protein